MTANPLHIERRALIETPGYLSERFDLDPATGHLTWKVLFPGRRAGSVTSSGYRKVVLEGMDFKEHRLVWVLTHGSTPPAGAHLDHINLNRQDNRPTNLRVASASQNVANGRVRKNNKTGLKGAYRHATTIGRFYSVICVNRRSTYLGMFDTAEEAHAAYMVAAAKHFGEYARAGHPTPREGSP